MIEPAASLRALRRRRPTPTPAIVHLGLGAFHRAHLAWYTDAVDDDRHWGIAAFTGRRPDLAELLAQQDGLYTLVERGPERDRHSVVESLVQTRPGTDVDGCVEQIASAHTAIVSLTITEAGYHAATAELQTLDRESDDMDQAGSHPAWSDQAGTDQAGLDHPLGRLVLGLQRRRDLGHGGLTVLPCDNLPANGELTGRLVVGLAERLDPELAPWIQQQVSFVATSVDRITPRTTSDDVAQVARDTGAADRAPVICEPFSNFVIAGEFVAGRPDWQRAEVSFVDDVTPYERRKLWLLNGGHSLLAYGGLLQGHRTVADAIADSTLRNWLEEFWDEACRQLTNCHGAEIGELQLEEFRQALVARFNNRRIAHLLQQISAEAVAKLRIRIVPILVGEQSAGRSGSASERIIAAWIELVRKGVGLVDAAEAEIAAACEQPNAEGALQELIRRESRVS